MKSTFVFSPYGFVFIGTRGDIFIENINILASKDVINMINSSIAWHYNNSTSKHFYGTWIVSSLKRLSNVIWAMYVGSRFYWVEVHNLSNWSTFWAIALYPRLRCCSSSRRDTFLFVPHLALLCLPGTFTTHSCICKSTIEQPMLISNRNWVINKKFCPLKLLSPFSMIKLDSTKYQYIFT